MKSKFCAVAPTNNSAVLGVIIGVATALLISLLLIASVTGLVLGGKLDEKLIQISIFVMQLIAVNTGVLLGTAFIKEKFIVVTGSIAASYILLLIGIGIAVYDGSFHGFGLSAISIVLGAAAGYLFRLKQQNRPRGNRKIRL